jgi:hypothetical protein
MEKVAKDALDKFSELLYGVAPGFVALFAMLLASFGQNLRILSWLFEKGSEWRGAGVGILLGLVSYAFHLAILEDFFMARFVIRLARPPYEGDVVKALKDQMIRVSESPLWKRLKTIVGGTTATATARGATLLVDAPAAGTTAAASLAEDTLPARELIPELTRARWARSASGRGIAAAAQAGLDESYLWLFFLYCSGYLLIAGGVLLLFSLPLRGILVFGSGLLFLAAAVVGDAKVTRHELWLIKRFGPLAERAPSGEPAESTG